MNEPSDAQLVAATLAGRRDAFAAIYDRYGDALHDVAMSMLRDPHEAADAVQDVFVIAAERLHQLREPDRLRAWLFAVLRNDVYRRSAKRRRTRPTESFAEQSVPAVADDAASRLEYDDLARLVRDAAEGLDDRDRLVLELSIRQGLHGRELADALGVSAEQSYSLVFRMRDRAERALGALVVARTNRAECRELDHLLRDWDGRFSVLVRKRVARHVDQCATCEPARRKVGALVAFGAAPAWAAPLALRDRVLAGFSPAGPGSSEPQPPHGAARPTTDASGAAATGGAVAAADLSWAPDGFPGAGRTARRGVVALVATALVVVFAGAIGALALRDDPPTTLVAAAVQTRTGPEGTTGAAGSATSSTTTVGVEPSTGGTSTTSTAAGGPPSSTTSPRSPVPTVPPAAPSTVAPTAPPAPTSTPTAGPSTTGGSPSTTLAPARLVVSPGRVAIGAATTRATITVRNDGGTPLTWTVEQASAVLVAQPASGTLAPGASVPVNVAVDRSAQPEGPLTATLTIGGDGGRSTVTFDGSTERPPTIGVTTTPAALTTLYTPASGCSPATALVRAAVTDETGLASVTLHWRPPGSPTSTSVAMALRDGAYVATLGPFTTSGTVEWWVRAADTRGNVTTIPLRTTPVGICIR